MPQARQGPSSGSSSGKKSRFLTDKQRLSIIQLYYSGNGHTKRGLAREFGVSDATVRKLLKSKDMFLRKYAIEDSSGINFEVFGSDLGMENSSNSGSSASAGDRTGTLVHARGAGSRFGGEEEVFTELEDTLYEWIRLKYENGGKLTSNDITEKAKQLAQNMDIQEFTTLSGWYKRFKARYQLENLKIATIKSSSDENIHLASAILSSAAGTSSDQLTSTQPQSFPGHGSFGQNASKCSPLASSSSNLMPNLPLAQVDLRTLHLQISATVQTVMLPLVSVMKNQRLFRRNQNAFSISAKTKDHNIQLHPIYKEVIGNGMGLPGDVPRVRQLKQLEMGQLVARPFPRTVGEAMSLTHEKLQTLSILFNDTFGVLEEESVDERRDKFIAFISGL